MIAGPSPRDRRLPKHDAAAFLLRIKETVDYLAEHAGELPRLPMVSDVDAAIMYLRHLARQLEES